MIELRKGEERHLELYEGDNVEEAVNEFSAKFGLSERQRLVLVGMIEEKLKGGEASENVEDEEESCNKDVPLFDSRINKHFGPKKDTAKKKMHKLENSIKSNSPEKERLRRFENTCIGERNVQDVLLKPESNSYKQNRCQTYLI